MEATTLSLIVIRTLNLEASLAFYQALGLTFVQEQHGNGPIDYSCNFNGLVLELYPRRQSSTAEAEVSTTMLGFKVASLEATLAELNKLGVKPKSQVKEADWGRWINVTDPGGHLVQLNEGL